MTTEKYLRRLKWLENMIVSKQEKVDVGRSRATNMVAATDKDPVQTSPKDRLGEILSDVVDNDKELQAYKCEYKTIMGQVETLSGEYSAAYVYLRFAKDRNVKEVARTLKISRSTAYRIHYDALEEFENLYGEIYKNAKNFSTLEHFGTL